MENSFTVNTKCEVIFEDKTYKSDVQDITKEYIAISIPVSNGEYLLLTRGETVDVIYYDEKNVYKFTSKVIGRKSEGIKMLLLSPPDKISKIQRRRFFRINILSKIKILKVKKNITEKQFNNLCANADEKSFSDAIMTDLSGGGLKAKTEMNVKTGDMFIIKLPITDFDVNIPCYCVRAVKEYETKYYCCGFSFYNINDRVRDKIIAYIFRIMREQNKKG